MESTEYLTTIGTLEDVTAEEGGTFARGETPCCRWYVGQTTRSLKLYFKNKESFPSTTQWSLCLGFDTIWHWWSRVCEAPPCWWCWKGEGHYHSLPATTSKITIELLTRHTTRHGTKLLTKGQRSFYSKFSIARYDYRYNNCTLFYSAHTLSLLRRYNTNSSLGAEIL